MLHRLKSSPSTPKTKKILSEADYLIDDLFPACASATTAADLQHPVAAAAAGYRRGNGQMVSRLFGEINIR